MRKPGLPPTRFRVRGHALARFRERVRPDLTFAGAWEEMVRLMVEAPLSAEPPSWCESQPQAHNRGYLLVAPGVCFVLSNYQRPNTEVPRGGATQVATVLTPREAA